MSAVRQGYIGHDAVPLGGVVASVEAQEVESGEAVVGAVVCFVGAVVGQGARVVEKEHAAEGVEFFLQHHAEAEVAHGVAVFYSFVVEIATGVVDSFGAFGT